jgi:OOP family OmpA-OmpF porin
MLSNQMKLLNKAGTVILLIAGLLLVSQAWAEKDNRYVTDSGSGVVKDAYGECWTTSGVKVPREECGDVMEEPEPVMVDGDDDGDGVPNSRDKCPNTPPGVRVDSNGCEIIESITINLDVEEFDFDSARLKPEMEAALDDVAARVQASSGDEYLDVVGHTDSTGPESYNLGLSERRAESAAEYLIGAGVDESRISTSGMGESEPIADNSTREGRARNRRVEIQTR